MGRLCIHLNDSEKTCTWWYGDLWNHYNYRLVSNVQTQNLHLRLTMQNRIGDAEKPREGNISKGNCYQALISER